MQHSAAINAGIIGAVLAAMLASAGIAPALMDEEVDKWAKVIRAANIKPD